MTKGLMVVVVAFVLMVQEREIPKNFYCTNHPKAPVDRKCDCHRQCELGPDGQIREQEDPKCKVYCHRDHCSCSSECDTHTL